MARGKKRGSVSAYFRGVFQERPQWLYESSNDMVLARYREDHGIAADKSIDPSVRNNLANLKSKLRKLDREGGGSAPADTAVASASNAANERLAGLEEQIDECLTLAKNLDRDGLEQIIKLLRRARNEVVWKIGQP